MNRLLVVALSVLLPISRLDAVPVADLYAVTISVENQSGESRTQGIAEGFRQVLARVAGDGSGQGWQDNPGLLRSAETALRSYVYDTGADAAGATGLLLNMTFDPQAVRSLLRRHGLKLWDSDRPLTLLWLQVAEEAGPRLVGDSEPLELAEPLKAAARSRGLPLQLPMLDLQELGYLENAPFWQDRTTLEQASARYEADIIAVGRVVQQAGEWRAHWSLWLEGREVAWDSSAAERDVLLQTGVEEIAGTLLREYAVTILDEAESNALVVVENLTDPTAYQTAFDYLSSVQGVVRVIPQRIKGDAVTFSLTLSGTLAELTRSITFGKLLQAAAAPPDFADAASIDLLHYRFIGTR